MPAITGLGWTFDTVADAYEKLRPGYPSALYRQIFAYQPVAADSHAVEIGIGSGQATLPFLHAGCSVTAVEPGANFCARCRDKFAEYPQFSTIEGKFEDVLLAENSCDLAYSASAFHWVPEDIGYRKVFAILRSGGSFARFANHPFRSKENPALADDIQQAYIRYYYPFHHKEPAVPEAYTEAEAAARAELALKYGFTDVCYALYERTRTFTADEYIRLLGTYSDHIAIDEPVRLRFFSEIAEAIERRGGTLTLHDTIDLQLARKP